MPQWYKTMDFTELPPTILTNNERGKRFILVNGNNRQIGRFNRFSPDNNRAYFTLEGKTTPISVSLDPLTGYKVYSLDKISKFGTYPLTPLPTSIQKNIAEYYGGITKRTKSTFSTFRKSGTKRVKKSKRSKRVKRTKRKSKKSRKSRK